ncbi:MAG: hypothetical protein QNL60_01465 [Flavobacteriales bacterium]|jgi:hypothetical protein
MEKPETRFRLRMDGKVVGYSKKINSSTFYSKDNYGWTGHIIEFNLSDYFTGSFDINRRAIYTDDIVEFKAPIEHQYGLIVFDDVLQTFQLLSVDGEEFIANDAVKYLDEHRYVWKSYRFIQNLM